MPDKKFWADGGRLDSDGDGLSDEFETRVLHTDPNLADTDHDGLNDLRERDFATSPLRPDSDGDGLNDLREVVVGTNPRSVDTDARPTGSRPPVPTSRRTVTN